MPRIHALGAELIFVGTGSAFFARGFREEFQVPVPILVDPERRSYAALALRRGGTSMLHPRMLANAARAARAGFQQTSTQGDALQMGGVLVLRKGGAVAFAFRSDTAGDHPPVAEVMAALEEAVGRGAAR